MMYGWTIIIPIVIVALWYFNRHKSDFSAKKENPVEILKRRFATGEITSQEYEERKTELRE